MNLPKRLLAIAYDTVTERVKLLEDEPEGYKADLYELMALLEKELLKQSEI